LTLAIIKAECGGRPNDLSHSSAVKNWRSKRSKTRERIRNKVNLFCENKSIEEIISFSNDSKNFNIFF